MRIEHIAVWVSDLEKIKNFYKKYFNASPSELYHNQSTGFKSYFLSFEDGSRIEIMFKEGVCKSEPANTLGYAHLSISLGSKANVEKYTETLRKDGYKIVSEPRTTGDGYYESIISDPENNLIELTV